MTDTGTRDELARLIAAVLEQRDGEFSAPGDEWLHRYDPDSAELDVEYLKDALVDALVGLVVLRTQLPSAEKLEELAKWFDTLDRFIDALAANGVAEAIAVVEKGGPASERTEVQNDVRALAAALRED